MNHIFLKYFSVLLVFIFLMTSTISSALLVSKPGQINPLNQFPFSSKKIDLHHNEYTDIVDYQLKSNRTNSNTLGLPDLAFVELKAWWGPINTSAVGLFVRYGVINYGDELNQSIPIESNLSFFAGENKSSFGYIIQKPLLYPTYWYPGEILGGCYFFDIDEKPSNITVVIDYNQSIQEINENNNQKRITVLTGIQLNGTIYDATIDGNRSYTGIVELSGCDPDSMSTFSYRTFRTDGNGSYALSLYPNTETGSSQQYTLRATKTADDLTMIQKTPSLRSADAYSLDFLFKGTQPLSPSQPFGRTYGRVDNVYLFAGKTIDNDQDKLYYKFYWGNGEFSEWMGPVESKQAMITNYCWHESGSYPVHVIIKDETGLITDWSEERTVTIRRPLSPFSGHLLQHIHNKLIELFIQLLSK